MAQELTNLQRFGWDPDKGQHAHRGSPYHNCKKCNMPHGAFQHRKIMRGEEWPITMADELYVQHQVHPEAEPFA